MNAGVLQFALELDSAGFLSGLDRSHARLDAFVASLASLDIKSSPLRGKLEDLLTAPGGTMPDTIQAGAKKGTALEQVILSITEAKKFEISRFATYQTTSSEGYEAAQAKAGPSWENGLARIFSKAFEDFKKGNLTMAKTIGDILAKSTEGPVQAAFEAMITGLNMATKKSTTDKPDEPPPPLADVKPQYTSLEKMGFVMDGIGNPSAQHLQETSQNTKALAKLLEDIYKNLSNPKKDPPVDGKSGSLTLNL